MDAHHHHHGHAHAHAQHGAVVPAQAAMPPQYFQNQQTTGHV
jgi:hypothetical protein